MACLTISHLDHVNSTAWLLQPAIIGIFIMYLHFHTLCVCLYAHVSIQTMVQRRKWRKCCK